MEISKEDQKILAEAHKQFRILYDANEHLRTSFVKSMKFSFNVAEGHWDSADLAERDKKKRAHITAHKLGKFVTQVVNNERGTPNRDQVVPVDDAGDKEIAKIYNYLINDIEYHSNYDEVFTLAGEHAVGGGFGFWRILTEYEPDGLDQVIRVKPIKNPLNVFLDERGRRAFIREGMSIDEFEETWPDFKEKPDDFEDFGDQTLWYEDERVFIAEYFRRVPVKKTIGEIVTGDGKKIIIEIKEDTIEKPLRTREVNDFKIEWYKLCGHAILERGEWIGNEIPIIEVVGQEIQLEGKTYKKSLGKDVEDINRALDYWFPLSLNTPIPTPDGWSTMGKLEIGDKLFDDNGEICEVLGESQIFNDRKCYQINFDDGAHIIADGEHPWQVEERTTAHKIWKTKIIPTKELRVDKHFIYMSKPLDLPEKELEIHPYVLGYWIGDGCHLNGKITSSDEDIEETIKNIVKCGYSTSEIKHPKDRSLSFTIFNIVGELKKLGIFRNKNIPKKYLRSSFNQRLELLQGLMDTDGSISALGQCSFTTVNEQLKNDFSELLRSLGIKARYCIREPRTALLKCKKQREIVSRKIQYQFSFTPPKDFPVFKLKRKADVQLKYKDKVINRRTGRYSIVSIEEVPSEPVKCIFISSDTHLYLAGNGMVPTHNTSLTEKVALSPKAPYLVTPQQIRGFEPEWDAANIDLKPYLRYNQLGTSGAPQRAPSPEVGTGELTMLNICDTYIRDILGMYESSMGAPSNERSGRAIQARASQSNLTNFHFPDNLRRARLKTKKMLINIIPKVYSNERTVRVIGYKTPIKLNEERKDLELGTTKILNDLSVGKYDIRASNPMNPTIRQRAEESLRDYMQYVPTHADVILPVAVSFSDIPGSDKLMEALSARTKQVQDMKAQELQQKSGGMPA